MATSSANNLLEESAPAVTADIDSDYDDLHLPDTEDEPDIVSKDDVGAPEIPFIRIHELPFGFDEPSKSFLIPQFSIQLEIVTVERSPSTHFLNPNLYIIQLKHGEFQWVIKRRYKHFQQLHQELRLFRASLAFPLPTKKHRERRLSYPSRERKNLPRFPKKPDALISQEEVQKRRVELETYLKNLVSVPIYRKHHETLRFLEIGPLSFINRLGEKHKEGWVKKRSGGRRSGGCLVRFQRAFISCFGIWGKRWLVVKDTFIALVRPTDGAIRAVLLFDQGFQVETGLMDMGIYNGIQVSNLSRHLLLKCWTRRKVREWMQELQDTAKSSARDFTQPNRYDSFAPVRHNIDCKWFIDGASYFEAVADALEMAKEEIFIADWWLSPEIYLKRPALMGVTWRLDHVLKRKAEQGVRVFVLLFKEMELGLSLNSFYSKQQLVNMHPNIRVLRHPDHLKDGVLLWSHHEKIVCIDQTYAFLGGLDLCYGRWDNYMHKLTDLGGVSIPRKLELSKSVSTFELGSEPPSTDLLINENSSPNTPTINIEPVYTNGIERTEDETKDEEAEKEKLRKEVRIDDEPVEIIKEDEKIKKKKSFRRWRNVINQAQEKSLESKEETIGGDRVHYATSKQGRARGVFKAVARFQSLTKQIRRRRGSLESIDSLNMGITWDKLDTPTHELRRSTSEIGLPQLGLQGSAKLWFGKDYTNFIVKDFVELDDPYKDLVDRNVVPRMPWHDISVFVQGSAARDVARHFIQRWNFTKFEKAKSHERYPYLMPKSYDFGHIPRLPKSSTGTLFCSNAQILRSVSGWSAGTKDTESSIHTAYLAAIASAKHFIYIENQFFISQAPGHKDVFNEVGDALFRRIMRAHGQGEVFRVYVVMPLLPAFEGEIGTATGTAIHAITHWNYVSISRGNDSLMGRLRKEGIDPKTYISFYGLRNYGTLNEKLVTELVYVHSKLMIVDDNTVIIGSANLNDRSLIGKRDSEIAVIITDEEFEPSVMNGKPYNAGKFACTLRRTLFREHLGLLGKDAPAVDIKDPLSDAFFKDVWLKTASVNTDVFEKVFHCIPTDTTQTFIELKKFMSEPGLVETDPEEAEKQVKRIQGHLVLMPLQFLFGEVLTPASGTKESLMPISLWT